MYNLTLLGASNYCSVVSKTRQNVGTFLFETECIQFLKKITKIIKTKIQASSLKLNGINTILPPLKRLKSVSKVLIETFMCDIILSTNIFVWDP